MNMKKLFWNATAASAALAVAVLTACGGGSDDAGAPITLSVQPASVTFTAPAGYPTGVCGAGGTQEVFVYGGAAPYTIDNTSPETVAVDKSQVGDRGGSFHLSIPTAATGTGGFAGQAYANCLTNAVIVVTDKTNKQTVFTVSNAPSTSASTPS